MTDTRLSNSEEAHKRREQFIDFSNKADLIKLRLAYEMWSEKDFKSLGFETWEEYCEAPLESGGLSRSRSYMTQLALTYEKFVEQLGVPEEKVLEIGARKLYSFKDDVNAENIDDFMIKANTMSMKDLRMDIKGIDQETCEHSKIRIIKRCEDCGKITL